MFSYIRQTSVLCTNIRNACTTITNQKTDNYWQYILNNCKNALTQPSTIPKETWENVRKHIIESECNPPNLDFIILRMFGSMNYPDVGISYYKFLADNNYNLSIPTIAAYLRLYHIKKDPISKSDKEHILNLYNTIKNQYTLFNEELSNVLVQCLCKMDDWQEAIKIIEKHEENDSSFLRIAYTTLISCLFNHKNEKLGYEYLTRSLQKNNGPFDDAYTTYLKYCLEEEGTFNIKIEKLFLLWSTYGIKPSQEIAFQCMNACIEHGWSVSKTIVSRSTCRTCNKVISKQSLSYDDYKRLLEATKKRLIFNNMHYVTSPKEIQSFIHFINKNKPYDIVVDGLNIMYIIKRDAREKLTRKIMQTLKYYKQQNKKVLIIGKQYMKEFIIEKGLKDVDCFLVRNNSKDDLFVLYAAFASGENTKVLSRDLLRQHVFALRDIELNALFKKWQLSHQFVIDIRDGYIQLNTLKPIDALVEKVDNSWHIPYVPSDKMSRMRHKFANHWLCFKKH